jgi:trigger factor
VVKVNVDKLERSKVSLSVEAPASVVDAALDKAYKTVVKRVNVPGFRRGKAPRYILERYYGKESLYEEAMKDVLPEQYREAVKEANIEPVDDPEFDEVHFKQGEDLAFKATVYVRPEVKLEDYSDICVPYEVPPVTDGDVSQQMEYLKERMSELLPLEGEQALEAGNFASCHVKGIEGGTFKADIDQDLSYVEVGREYGLVPGLAEALKGMKKGETKEFTGTYPAENAGAKSSKDAEALEEAGGPKQAEQPRQTRFLVEVKECYRKHVPAEEEFLKNLSRSTMDEVMQDLRSRLTAMRTDSARRQHSDKVEEALLSKATVDVPGVMIERKQEDLYQRFVQRLQEAGTSVEAYLRSTGRTPEDILKDFEKDAERDVKRDLVLDVVSAKEDVKVPEETVNNVVEALARETGKDVQAMKTTLELRGALAGIEQDLLRLEALRQVAARAAQKAGTPLPAHEAGAEAAEAGAAKGVAGEK